MRCVTPLAWESTYHSATTLKDGVTETTISNDGATLVVTMATMACEGMGSGLWVGDTNMGVKLVYEDGGGLADAASDNILK